jgi:hypothetical protein
VPRWKQSQWIEIKASLGNSPWRTVLLNESPIAILSVLPHDCVSGECAKLKRYGDTEGDRRRRRRLPSPRGLMDSTGNAPLVFASGADLLESGSLAKADCLITDVRLPGMHGIELQRRVRSARPDLRSSSSAPSRTTKFGGGHLMAALFNFCTSRLTPSRANGSGKPHLSRDSSACSHC